MCISDPAFAMIHLSKLVVPFDMNQASFKFYLTFTNSEGSKIHVPFTVSNIRRFRACSEKRLLREIQTKMDAAFKSLGPMHEWTPPDPDQEYCLKAQVRARNWSKPIEYRLRSGVRLNKKPQEAAEPVDPSPSALPDCPTDLSTLESFTQAFIAKRMELNLSQKDVARSLQKLYGLHRSTTLISRIERFDLSLTNFLKLYPILLQWLKDTESFDSRNAIVRVASHHEVDIPSSQSTSTNASVQFPRRRKRSTINSETTKALQDAFQKNVYLPTSEVTALAHKLDLDPHVVRIWFRNRRARFRRSTKMNISEDD